MDSFRHPENYMPEELKGALSALRQSIEELSRTIDQDERLSYQLYGALGFKSWSLNEFTEMKSHGLPSPEFHYFWGISYGLADQLTSEGFDPGNRRAFDRWNVVAQQVAAFVLEIRERAYHVYETRIFFNGPAPDFEKEVVAHLHQFNDKPIDVCLGYATDELLRPLVEYQLHPAATRVNLVLSYSVAVPVDSGEDAYVEEYYRAARIAQFVLDSLRLCRPKDDVGVLALRVLPKETVTPHIRESWDNHFHPELARFEPRRFDFSACSLTPLDRNEIESIRAVINARLPTEQIDQRFEYAIGRFRNSIERYSPNDPERLLEWAIALESLYLNDNTHDRGELTYRLSLRVARLLEADFEKRKNLASLITSLYEFRSRIAHGSALSQMKSKKRERLQEVLDRGPEIVANSILRLLQVAATHTKENYAEFWKSIELA